MYNTITNFTEEKNLKVMATEEQLYYNPALKIIENSIFYETKSF